MKCFEADGLQLVEGGEAELGGLEVALVAEGGEDVFVLLTVQAVGIGNDAVDGSTDGPAGVVFTSRTGHSVFGIGSRQMSPSCSVHSSAPHRSGCKSSAEPCV